MSRTQRFRPGQSLDDSVAGTLATGKPILPARLRGRARHGGPRAGRSRPASALLRYSSSTSNNIETHGRSTESPFPWGWGPTNDRRAAERDSIPANAVRTASTRPGGTRVSPHAERVRLLRRVAPYSEGDASRHSSPAEWDCLSHVAAGTHMGSPARDETGRPQHDPRHV